MYTHKELEIKCSECFGATKVFEFLTDPVSPLPGLFQELGFTFSPLL